MRQRVEGKAPRKRTGWPSLMRGLVVVRIGELDMNDPYGMRGDSQQLCKGRYPNETREDRCKSGRKLDW